jgi:4-amino-4-deoxy-L-arabinose transferase-like glycosyltransferase
MMQQFRFLQVIRLSRMFWIVAVVAMVLILLFLPRSPLPWLDETFFASTSLAVARGGPPIPTVLGAFPHTGRVDLFYGPLVFFLGSLDVRVFGLSITSWRLLGFFGAVGAVLSASWMSRCLDRSSAAMAASAMMVALSQGIGARATTGRLDTITITLEIFSLICTLRAMRVQESRVQESRIQESRRSAFLYAALAGILCALAALSTPRAFPFVLGLFVAIALELLLAPSRELITRGLIIAVAALLPVWGWTLSRGTNPIGWLRFIAETSRGDKISVSPILHGSWHFFDEPLVPLLSGLLFTFVTLLVFTCAFGSSIFTARRSTEIDAPDVLSAVRLASIAVLINYVVSFLTISRFWDYEVFVVPLVIPVLIALTAKILRSGAPRTLQRIVLLSWLALAIVLVAIRSGKVVAWLASYHERAPQPLQDFISSKVPANSRVFGPEEFYFYAVEAAGSHYLFVRPRIPSGLVSKLDHDLNWQEQLNEGQPVYLIWPKDDILPPGLAPENLLLEGSFTAQRGNEPASWRKAGWGSGYPPTNLYRIVDAQSAKNDPQDRHP